MTIPQEPNEEYRDLTAAAIRELPDQPFSEVLFLESTRFYKLPKQHPEFDKIVAELRQAIEDKRSLRVWFTPTDAVILRVKEL
ncbi:MAG: hypothetical protein ACR2NP_16900 [Pirellulaceae bacterium]